MIKIRIKVDVLKNNILDEIKNKLRISKSDIISYEIIKQSIDARNKEKIYYIYEINVDVNNENKILKNNKDNNISIALDKIYDINFNSHRKLDNIIIVGSGPASLFAAYTLAYNNYKPIIIERGEKVEDRIKSVEKFFESGLLNINSNVQYGEGGAGTFSDGKLHTAIKDKDGIMKAVLKIFVECGAPEEILYCYKPHIGTDLLRQVVINMRNKIIAMGGKFYFNTMLTNLIIENNKIVGIEVNNQENLSCNYLLLGIGNSARDTFRMLYKNNLNMESKPFAIGVRVQHLQKDIDLNQYGDKYTSVLSKASYKLTHQTAGRGVYSFCMCPGGYVINASSNKEELVVNGMSNYARESSNANSAIIVTVNKNDYGESVLDGIKYQEQIEKKAYSICNGKIPIQKNSDFINNTVSNDIGKIKPIMKGSYKFANINEILPKYICDAIKVAMKNFDKKIKGFNNEDVIISGVETRTSSPVRILRDDYFESNIKGIYPIGEGAGYAGGITSSAIDGIRCVEKILR